MVCGTKDVVDINTEEFVVSVGLDGVDDIWVKTRSGVWNEIDVGGRCISRITHVRGIRVNHRRSHA